MTKAMILSAGYGTRLRPLSLELPKPLVWVGDRPAIGHIAARLVEAGISDIVVNTHHRADAFSAEALARIPGRLSIVTEASILGTGGGLANAAPQLGDGDVVVWNGDILAPLDVRALLEGAEGLSGREADSRSPGAVLAIVPRPSGEGTVGVSRTGDVVRLRGERFGEEASAGDFLGISLVTEALRRALPIPGCLIGDGVLPWLRAGGRIATFQASLAWDDIGSVDAYLRANARWLSDAKLDSYVGPSAAVADGVTLKDTVIGEGAHVIGEGALEGCVVWPFATARAPAKRTVFTTGGLTVCPG